MTIQASQGNAHSSAVEQVKFLKRGFFQRVWGKCATSEPRDPNCWNHSSGQIFIDLSRAPELAKPSGAVRLEGKSLPFRVLIVRSEGNDFRAFVNSCTHGGRRLDPVPETTTVQCCSVGKSTFDSEGKVVYGPAKQVLKRLTVEVEPEKLIISLV